MEKLTKSLGPHTLNTRIAGSFSRVDLNRCFRLPVAELEFYEKLVAWFPKHQIFIAGGFASYVMGYKSYFSDVDVYVMCESSDDARKLYWELEGRTHDMRKADKSLGTEAMWSGPRIRCEAYGLFIYRRDDEVCSILDMRIDVKICVVPPHWHVGRFRYIDMLTVVVEFFDVFQSMCIIDSVDLASKRCSALAIHQFRHAVADTDARSLLSIQKRGDCRAACKKHSLPKNKLRCASESMFWDDIVNRCEQYKLETRGPNLKIGVPRLSSLCLGALITVRSSDLVKFYRDEFDTYVADNWFSGST